MFDKHYSCHEIEIDAIGLQLTCCLSNNHEVVFLLTISLLTCNNPTFGYRTILLVLI